jgi:hypothetical protein
MLTLCKKNIIINTSTHTERLDMRMFILGAVFGLVLATVGFSGIARMLDNGIDTVKTHSQEMAK